MRTGILWRGGEITMHVNIEQTVSVFLNARANVDGDTSVGPQQIVTYNNKKNRWVPFKPNPYQMELICLSAEFWYKNRRKALTPVNDSVTV